MIELFMRLLYGLLIILMSLFLLIFGIIGVFFRPCNFIANKLSNWIVRTLDRLYAHILVQDDVFDERDQQKQYEAAVEKAVNKRMGR